MKRFYNVSTYTKILFLIIVSGVLFSILYFSLYYYTVQQEKQVTRNTIKQFDNEVKTLLMLNSETYISTITDNTYWDDFVKYLSTKDVSWYDEYITSLLSVYKLDYVAVYDINSNFLRKSSSSKIKSVDFIPKEMMERLYKKKLQSFYMRIPEGVIEVFGATVHPSNDPLKNKTKPSGYFFMVRLLNKNYFNRLELVSNSKISFSNEINKNAIDKKTVFTIIPLKDWKNDTISSLVFKRPFNFNFSITLNILLIIIIANVIYFLINIFYSRKLVYRPLKLITGYLKPVTTRQ
jgi:hypothetical protein